MIECVILGAGLGGLSAANALIEKGIEVVILEASTELRVKTCGEFLSYAAIPLLEEWEICPTIPINNVNFYSRRSKTSFQLPMSCGSMPRLELEQKLLDRFLRMGGKIKYGCKVSNVVPSPHFQLKLENDDTINAEQLIVSTGRLQVNKFTPRYMGIKNHLVVSQPIQELNMIFFKGGYFGVSPINASKVVVSCLLKKGYYEKNPEEMILKKLSEIKGMPCLMEPVFDQWLKAPIGSFGCKQNPLWPNSYFIGDAAGTIAPLLGEGMTMALHSGKMLADYLASKKWKEYREAWNARYQNRIRLSKALNLLAFSSFSPILFQVMKKYPKLLTLLHKK